MDQLPEPQHAGRGADLPEPVADAEPVQPAEVRAATRGPSGSIEAEHLLEGGLHLVVRRAVGRRAPGRPVADVDGARRHLAGDLARLRDVRRGQGQAELLDQAEVAGVRVAHHLAAELDAAAVGELDLLDAAADPVAAPPAP